MLKVAVLGAGGMAGTHARGYAALPNARLVGVFDSHEERGRRLGEEHRIPAFTDFDAMVAEVKPDVIDVCVPTPFHAEFVLRAAELRPRGIVVEKPMGRTVEECERMMAACAAAEVPLFPAHVLRFFPEFATAKAQVDAGAVGEVAAVRTRRGGPFPHGTDDWYSKFDWSGGVLLDLIIHDFDWLRWTFGPVERVFAKGLAAREGEGAVGHSDYALVTMRFASGVMAHVEGTWADPGGFKANFEIAGDAGLLEYNFNQPASPPLVSALGATDGTRAGVPVPESPMATNPYHAELAHFLDCIETGASPIVTPQDGLEAVRISQACIESARTGRRVEL